MEEALTDGEVEPDEQRGRHGRGAIRRRRGRRDGAFHSVQQALLDVLPHVSAEFPDADHPARKVAAAHKRELRRRLEGIAERLGVTRPNELGGQLALLINGAFVSSQVLSRDEAAPLLRASAEALIAAAT